MKRKYSVLALLALLIGSLLLSACNANAENKKTDEAPKEKAETGEVVEMTTKVKSSLGFDETVSKVEEFLKEKNITLFYTADHKKNAEEVNLEMENNKVLVFGDPKVGTNLMKDNPSIAYELPLRISVYQEGEDVYLIYKKPSLFAKDYTLKDESKEILGKMDGLYEALTNTVK